LGWLKYATWHILRMRYVHCRVGWNRSVMMRTLLSRPKQIFVRVIPRIAVRWLKYATWQSLRMRYKLWKLGWNRSVMKGALLKRPKYFFVPISLALQLDDWNMGHGTPSPCSTSSSSLVEIGQ
jgi:hypothetical protein